MLRRVAWPVCVLILTMSVATIAQDRQSRFGQGGGFSMFGGGSSALLLAAPEVQKELAISDEQKGLLDGLLVELREQGRNLFGSGGFQDFKNLSREEIQQRMASFQKRAEEMNKKSDEMINMILEPPQTDRLSQLRLQREGVASFLREDIAQKLGLTDEQRDRMARIQHGSRPDRPSGGFLNFRDMSSEEQREFFKKAREHAEKVNSDTLAVLTPDQREAWTKLQGKKFEFPEPRGFGGPNSSRKPTEDKNKRDDK